MYAEALRELGQPGPFVAKKNVLYIKPLFGVERNVAEGS